MAQRTSGSFPARLEGAVLFRQRLRHQGLGAIPHVIRWRSGQKGYWRSIRSVSGRAGKPAMDSPGTFLAAHHHYSARSGSTRDVALRVDDDGRLRTVRKLRGGAGRRAAPHGRSGVCTELSAILLGLLLLHERALRPAGAALSGGFRAVADAHLSV